MRSKQDILDSIATDAAEGASLGSLDRATVAELIEAEKEFPDQLVRSKEKPLIVIEEMEEGYFPGDVLCPAFPFPGPLNV